ncbi:hypothetical protein CS542_05220 [Pedobacter sp. IW39]|nr:hypothetical protein CS542_05220 [Pedobacter sp. IW39]
MKISYFYPRNKIFNNMIKDSYLITAGRLIPMAFIQGSSIKNSYQNSITNTKDLFFKAYSFGEKPGYSSDCRALFTFYRYCVQKLSSSLLFTENGLKLIKIHRTDCQ